MNLYRSLVRTRLDYGAVNYQSATPSALKDARPRPSSRHSLFMGAFRTSPIESMYVELNKWSLHLQRCYMSFTYYHKVNEDEEHPTPTIISDVLNAALFNDRLSLRQPYLFIYSHYFTGSRRDIE